MARSTTAPRRIGSVRWRRRIVSSADGVSDDHMWRRPPGPGESLELLGVDAHHDVGLPREIGLEHGGEAGIARHERDPHGLGHGVCAAPALRSGAGAAPGTGAATAGATPAAAVAESGDAASAVGASAFERSFNSTMMLMRRLPADSGSLGVAGRDDADARQGRRDEHRAERGPRDHDVLGGMEQRHDLPAAHHEAADHGSVTTSSPINAIIRLYRPCKVAFPGVRFGRT